MMSLIATLSLLVSAAQASTGTVTKISCMNGDKKLTNVAQILGEAGQEVSLETVRSIVQDSTGATKSGMGIVESSSRMNLVVEAKGICGANAETAALVLVEVVKN